MSDESDQTPSELADLDPEQAAELQAAMDEARQRLSSVPAETVVINHVMGLYELGAIHLSNTPPNLESASLAIDAMAAVVETLGDRLGPDAAAMRDALANIRMAFVTLSSTTGQDSDPGAPDASE